MNNKPITSFLINDIVDPVYLWQQLFNETGYIVSGEDQDIYVNINQVSETAWKLEFFQVKSTVNIAITKTKLEQFGITIADRGKIAYCEIGNHEWIPAKGRADINYVYSKKICEACLAKVIDQISETIK